MYLDSQLYERFNNFGYLCISLLIMKSKLSFMLLWIAAACLSVGFLCF